MSGEWNFWWGGFLCVFVDWFFWFEIVVEGVVLMFGIVMGSIWVLFGWECCLAFEARCFGFVLMLATSDYWFCVLIWGKLGIVWWCLVLVFWHSNCVIVNNFWVMVVYVDYLVWEIMHPIFCVTYFWARFAIGYFWPNFRTHISSNPVVCLGSY